MENMMMAIPALIAQKIFSTSALLTWDSRRKKTVKEPNQHSESILKNPINTVNPCLPLGYVPPAKGETHDVATLH